MLLCEPTATATLKTLKASFTNQTQFYFDFSNKFVNEFPSTIGSDILSRLNFKLFISFGCVRMQFAPDVIYTFE